MKSSSGEHYLALDHVRALAAFMVFCWHFLHGTEGDPIPYGHAPVVFPLSFFSEGHIGVALFFVLSGYLFMKLLQGRNVSLPAFYWNRFIRLFPLLAVVTIMAGFIYPGTFADYARSLADTNLPNGGWSIVIEAQFYLLLPALLFFARHSPRLLLACVVAAILFRLSVWVVTGTVQEMAYWTLAGRIDQFILGMAAAIYRDRIRARHWLAPTVFTGASLMWWSYNVVGGYAAQSLDAAWIIIPTLQGACFAFLVAYYDTSLPVLRGIAARVSRGIAYVGEWSYSIYLLHFFYVFHYARFANGCNQFLSWDGRRRRLLCGYAADLCALLCRNRAPVPDATGFLYAENVI